MRSDEYHHHDHRCWKYRGCVAMVIMIAAEMQPSLRTPSISSRDDDVPRISSSHDDNHHYASPRKRDATIDAAVWRCPGKLLGH